MKIITLSLIHLNPALIHCGLTKPQNNNENIVQIFALVHTFLHEKNLILKSNWILNGIILFNYDYKTIKQL